MSKNAKLALTLLHAMQSHAKDKAEVIEALLVANALILEPAGIGLLNARGGTGSFFFCDYDDTSTQFHLRDGGKGKIVVLSHYRTKQAKKLATLSTASGVLRWAERVVKAKAATP